MRRVVLIVLYLAFVVGIGQWMRGTGLAAVNLGSVSIRDEHPRIYLTQETIPELRNRCRTISPISETYRRIKALVDDPNIEPAGNLEVAPNELINILIVYMVEDRDATYLNKAKRWLNWIVETGGGEWEYCAPHSLHGLSVGYDWLYPDLSEEEKQTYANLIIQLADDIRGNYGGRYPEWPNQYSDYANRLYWRYVTITFAGLALYNEGGYAAKADEYLSLMGTELKEHLIPAKNQVGDDGGWHEGGSYIHMNTYAFAYALEAWRTGTTPSEDLLPQCSYLRNLAQWIIYGTRPHDGSYAEVNDTYIPAEWGEDQMQAEWYMPLLEARYGDSLAKYICSKIYPAPNELAESWAYLLWFDPTVSDLNLDTLPKGMHFHGLGFVVMRTGWEEDDTFALFKAGNFYSGHQTGGEGTFILHRKGTLATVGANYGGMGPEYDFGANKPSSYHNALLIGGEQIHWPDEQVQFYQEIEGTQYDRADIIAYQTGDDYDYALADITKSFGEFDEWGPQVTRYTLDNVQRAFIFLRPDYFVVFDRIDYQDAALPTQWLIHSLTQPTINGDLVTIQEGNGKLFCRVLFPEDVMVSTGLNDQGRYRTVVELTNPSMPGSNLLHILQPCDLNTPSDVIASAVPITSADLIGARIANRVIIFKTTEGKLSDVSYTVSASGVLNHLLTDMSEGMYYIHQNDIEILNSPSIASAAGILSFESSGGGDFLVTQTLPLNVPKNVTATADDTYVDLGWENPSYPGFSGVLILRRTERYPVHSTDGTVIYDGTNTSARDENLPDGTYYYAAFSYDNADPLNYSSPAYAKATIDNTPPTINNVTSTSGGRSATIRWDTDEPSTSFVEYGLTTEYGLVASDNELVESHQVRISNLDPRTTYHYRVTSTDAWGNSSSSLDRVFATVGRMLNVPSSDYPTIQAAIDAAAWGDVIQVAAGMYSPSSGETFPIMMKSGVSLSGAGPDVTILDAEASSETEERNVVIFDNSEKATIKGFTIRGGYAGEGGGILIEGGDSDVRITDNIILKNTAMWGGAGIAVRNGARATISNSLIRENGGVGIGLYQGEVTITNNIIAGNSGGEGINCAEPSGTVSIINNTIVGQTGDVANGIYLDNASPIIKNNIIVNNAQMGIGAGGTSAPEISYNDVWNNKGGNYESCSPGTGDILEDPLFVNEAQGDYRLQGGSPCIDAGDPDPSYNDPDGTRNDMGAYGGPRIITTEVAEEDRAQGLPTNFVLFQNYPNPFNVTTLIRYQLPQDAFVQLRIYNVNGQIVERLFDGFKEAGVHSHSWRGLNDEGKEVGSGVYLYRLKVNGERIFVGAKKMVLLR